MHEGKSDADVVLKGCIRAERIEEPDLYVHELLKRVKKDALKRIYQIGDFNDEEDFLKLVAI